MGKTDEDEATEKEIFRTQNVPEKEKERPMYKREARDSRPANPPHQSNVTKQISSYHPDVFSGTVALTSQHSGELRVQDVLQGSDPMMEKTDRKMPNGKPFFNCKVCGKEDTKSNIRQHIENNHMEGRKLSGRDIRCHSITKATTGTEKITYEICNLILNEFPQIHNDDLLAPTGRKF